MKNTLLLNVVLLLLLIACGDQADESGSRESGETDESTPITAEDQAKLDALSKPALPKMPEKGSLEAFFVQSVRELMVKGTAGFDKNGAIKHILDDLEALGLTPRGRPEGLVRDIVTRMIEDMESFRPPNFTAEQMDDISETMLRNLGKSYLIDLRNLIDPGSKQHEGSLRRVAEIAADKVMPGHEAITWKTIGGYTFRKDEPLPDRILAMDGKKIAHLGFMFPLKEQEDIHEFLLVESLWTCCFGEPPQVTDTVKITLPADKPGVFLMPGPVLVHGTFKVKVEEDEGWVIGVYRMQADRVEAYK